MSLYTQRSSFDCKLDTPLSIEEGIHRGNIYWVALPEIEDDIHGQKGTRPCVIISSQQQCVACATLHVVPLTTVKKRSSSVTHVPIRMQATGKQSQVLCEQLQRVDRSRIGNFIETCTHTKILEIEEGIAYALGFK